MKVWEFDTELRAESINEEAEKSWQWYQEHVGNRAIPKVEFLFTAVEYFEHFLEAYGEPCTVHWKISKVWGNISYNCIVDGPEIDPIGQYDDDTWYSRYFMRNYEKGARYHYDRKRHQNHIQFEAPLKPKKRSMIRQILLAFLLAVAVFFVLRLFPETVKDMALNGIITPVFNKITVMIAGMATPLVFLSVIGGIVGVGSSTKVGQIGGKFVSNMMVCYGFTATVLSAVAVMFYGLSSVSSGGDAGAVGELVKLVLDMMPNNLFECFVNDNALQVIVLAIFIGDVLLLMGDKAAGLHSAVESLEGLVNKMMTLLCKLLPAVVFLGVLRILFMDISETARLAKTAVAFVLCAIAIEIFVMIRFRVITGASPFKLFKVQIPTTMMNLATSSQVGTMPENMRCLKEDVGVDEKLLNFCLPLGIVTYMPNGAAFLGLVGWGIADLSGVPINGLSLVKIAVISVVVAIAAPPIPGSAFAVMPIIFSTCSIPLTYYSLAIILGTVLGYFLPVLNGYALQLETIITAYKLGQIDMEKFAKFKAGSGEK